MDPYETDSERQIREERRRRLTSIIGAMVEDRHRAVLALYGITEIDTPGADSSGSDSVLRARKKPLALPPPDRAGAPALAGPRHRSKRTVSR